MSAETVRCAVVFGGRSGEHPVSCLSAASILAHLDRSRFTAVPVLIHPDGFWSFGVDDPSAYAGGNATTVAAVEKRMPPRDPAVSVAGSVLAGLDALRACDVVFPALHGPYGEDGTLQSCLAAAGVPFVGSGVLASALAMDKVRTKSVVAAAGLSVVGSAVLTGDATDLPRADRERLGLPVFVKPVRGGSSLGVTRVEDWDDLPEAVRHARSCGPEVLVEAEVVGREVDIGVLEHPDGTIAVSPPLEIVVPPGQVFDYSAKYEDTGTVLEVPARLDPGVAREMAEQARTAFTALGCAGLARVDFFVEAGGRLVLNEVNTFPGFTAASQYPRMWQAAGMSYTTLLDTLVDTALARSPGPAGGGTRAAGPPARAT